MTATLPAIRKTLSIPLKPDRAFEIFTVGLADWWPLNHHSLSASEGKSPQGVEVQPYEGGRIVETRHDGNRAAWATITHWIPGQRVAVDWYVGRSPAQATHIDVTFNPASGGTEVVLIHTGFERLGTAGEAAAANYDEGWDLVIGERFRAACEEPE